MYRYGSLVFRGCASLRLDHYRLLISGETCMNRYPFLSLQQALLVLRIATPLFFMAHAAMRIANGTIPQFGGFMETLGFPFGVPLVSAISLIELIGGTMMIVGFQVRWAATALFAIAATGIVLIHFGNGWWVGEHGTGGMEYSVALIVMLLVVAAADRDRRRPFSVS